MREQRLRLLPGQVALPALSDVDEGAAVRRRGLSSVVALDGLDDEAAPLEHEHELVMEYMRIESVCTSLATFEPSGA